MRINNVEIEDTFAEAFNLYFARILITSISKKYAYEAAREATGYGTSLIGCSAEAGIEKYLSPKNTPDGRHGYVIQIYTSKKNIEKELINRIGQCILTAPGSRVFNYLESEEKVQAGYKLKYFGDGYEKEVEVFGRKCIAIPIMFGEFIVEKEFCIKKGIAGGNFIIIAKNQSSALLAGEAAVEAISSVDGVITPFPAGLCASGSKVGSRYKFLKASTNEIFCPTLKNEVENSKVKDAGAAIEVVVNGVDLESVKNAMREGILAATKIDGVIRISAGNYGGKLGGIKINLHELFQ